MTGPLMVITAIVLGALLAIATWRLALAKASRSAVRARYFENCRPLFDTARQRLAATGFPRLAGRYRGKTFDLQVVPDTLTFRKLPALWVLVSLPEPMPVKGRFDLLVRPGGTETFSAFHTLPHQRPGPPGCPDDCAIHTDDPSEQAFESVMGRHLDLFEDPRVKEVICAPEGLRIVFLAEEADRGRYLIFRDAEMGAVPLDTRRLEPFLQRLVAFAEDIHEFQGARMKRKEAA